MPDATLRTVLLLERVHPDADAILAAAGLEVRRHDAALEGRDLVDALADVDVVGLRSKSRLTADVLAAAPRLQAVGCFCIGTNQVATEEAGDAGVPVFNSPFSNTRSVAEMTLAEVIALHRGLFTRSSELHAGRWAKTASGAHEVRGRTLGIVGYGHIGSQVSILAEALGMRVVYHDVAERLPLGNARPLESLEALLAESDCVTLHVPATEATRGLVGADAIARMRPGAMLINNARGSVVDVDALADALRDGRLGGAALDVFPQEPASNQAEFASPLRGLPNVILTPHVGGSTQEAQAAIARDVAGKLARYATTGTTSSAVNVPEVDLPAALEGRHRILHWHRNVPGVLSRLHALLAERDVNVHGEYLATNPRVGYVIVDVDPHQGPALRDSLDTIPETIRVRPLF